MTCKDENHRDCQGPKWLILWRVFVYFHRIRTKLKTSVFFIWCFFVLSKEKPESS